jgi:hypothetical protein
MGCYKGYDKEGLSSLHIYTCAVSQLPRRLLDRFLASEYLAGVSQSGPSQLPNALVVFVTL